MRAIRQLEPDTQIEAPTRRRQWNAVFGAFFAIGCLLLVFGVVIGSVSHMQWAYEKDNIPSLPSAEESAAWISQIDDMSPVEMWLEWQNSKHETIPPISMHAVLSRHASGVLQRAMAFYGIAAAGLLIVAATVALGTRRKK